MAMRGIPATLSFNPWARRSSAIFWMRFWQVTCLCPDREKKVESAPSTLGWTHFDTFPNLLWVATCPTSYVVAQYVSIGPERLC